MSLFITYKNMALTNLIIKVKYSIIIRLLDKFDFIAIIIKIIITKIVK